MSTSMSDLPSYRAACLRAATDYQAFKVFKHDPALNFAWEHVTPGEGWSYLTAIRHEMQLLESSFDNFRVNDAIGDPRVTDYGPVGKLSPTTLRYIYVLGDLIRRFGSLANIAIWEIGGGYGGQHFIASTFFGRGINWGIIDLPEAVQLQRRYGASATEFLEHVSPFDLVVSNYAFSELNRDVQELYVERMLRHARHGYITCNFENQGGRMTWADMQKAIPGSKRSAHEPFPADGCFLWTW